MAKEDILSHREPWTSIENSPCIWKLSRIQVDLHHKPMCFKMNSTIFADFFQCKKTNYWQNHRHATNNYNCWCVDESSEGSIASFVNSFRLWVFSTKAGITLFFPLYRWNVNSIFHGAFWTASWIFHLFGVTRHWFWFLDLLSLPQVVWRLSTSQFLSSSLQLSCSVKSLPACAGFFFFSPSNVLVLKSNNFRNYYLTMFHIFTSSHHPLFVVAATLDQFESRVYLQQDHSQVSVYSRLLISYKIKYFIVIVHKYKTKLRCTFRIETQPVPGVVSHFK